MAFVDPAAALVGKRLVAGLLGHSLRHPRHGQMDAADVRHDARPADPFDPFGLPALAADARPGIGHADDAVRPAVEPHRERRGLFHGRIKLGGQFLRAAGQQIAIHQIDVARAVHRDLVAPAGHGRIAVRRIDAAAAEHERHRPARFLVALVSPQRRKGQLGEEID